jgi:hypothetical protein
MDRCHTFGGLHESEALHWNAETLQQFGHIVFLLSGASAEDRKKGRNEFYEFKRHFMEDEFNDKVVALELFRMEHNVKGLFELLEEIGDQLVEKQILPAEASRIDISEFVEIAIRPLVKRQSMEESIKSSNFFDPAKAEQLSLF